MMAKGVIANEEEHENYPISLLLELDECEDEEGDGEVGEDEYEVEKFKVNGRHFSHNHRLSLLDISSKEDEDKQEEEMDDDNFCRICGLPIFISSEPAYTCSKANNACKFFLHQQCAIKLPPKFSHPSHRPNPRKHILRIVKQRSSTKCMTYECEDCDDFKIHPLVVVSGVQIKLINHKSHPSHQMVAVCKENICECDACGEIQKGFFFACQQCNFWIHQDCTTLPNIVSFASHPHSFILAYSLPPDQINDYCILCKKQLFISHNGIYFCPQTKDFAHAACGRDKFTSKRSTLELMQLPDDELNAFPASVIRRYAETIELPLNPNVSNVHGDNNDKLTIDKYHKHPLILTHQVSTSSTTKNLACDLCTRPINLIPIFPTPTHEVSVSSPLFYKCVDHCPHFAAHRICADILPTTVNFSMPDLATLTTTIYRDVSSYMFSSIFHCRFCHRPCNGLCYYLFDEDENGGKELQVMIDDLPFFFDLECMVAPVTMKHASHAQHILYRTNRLLDVTPFTCCQDDALLYDVYRCITCPYYIHIRCAMLPKRIVYPQYHHHPLHLIFTTTIATAQHQNHNYEYEDTTRFCEVCEEDIDPLNYWFYYCSECDQSFHINCIPSVGYLSKVKFGGTFSLPDSHNHPLKLKRMLTEHTQRCGHCKQIIQGLVDQMAFFCSRCHYWIHFFCAAAAHNRLASSNRLKLYSEFDDAIMERLKKKMFT